jgi:hypothetical protein
MKISEALDGLKLDPTKIAVLAKGQDGMLDKFYPRSIFWHPARDRFMIYELSLGYSSRSLNEKTEIYLSEVASEEWAFTDFNTWYQSEFARLEKEEADRKQAAEAKKANG